MEYISESREPGGRKMRRTLRLRFRVEGGEVRLLSREKVEMICPPSGAERPEAGKHGGHWLELRDGREQLLFYRTLHFPFGNSVAMYSPDGTIRRVFGPGTDNEFDVLVPDESHASHIVLMGEPPPQAEQVAGATGASAPMSGELFRFELTGDIPSARANGVGR